MTENRRFETTSLPLAAALLCQVPSATLLQVSQQQKQVQEYNQAIIEQQKAGARIVNAIANQVEQR